MLNIIWTSFFLIAALAALGQVVFLGNTMVLNKIMEAMFSMAKTGFEISLGLTGVMTLWLGLMKIGEAAGAIRIISRWAAPVLEKLFPDIPPDHPAFGAMTINIAANVLGLDNAATPLGLRKTFLWAWSFSCNVLTRFSESSRTAAAQCRPRSSGEYP